MIRIEVYGRQVGENQACRWCERAKALLAKRGLSFSYIDITENAALQAEFAERTDNAATVPQIFVGTRHVGGFVDLAAADHDGSLFQMLQGEAL